VSVDPNGRDLVLTRNQSSNPVLVRVPVSGGKEENVLIESGHFIAPVATGARAIDHGGKILIAISPSDSWFYRVVILDPASGHVTPIKINYAGDTLCANWAADGRILSVGLPLKSHVWQFRPAAK
jgi:hypothetical protein